MSEKQVYKEWLNTAETARGILETIEVYQKDGFGSLYLANWDASVVCTIEDDVGFEKFPPVDVGFTASRFYLEPSETKDGTNQTTSIVMASLDGVLYDTFRDMTAADRQLPIYIIPRMYWTDTYVNQLIAPAPRWTLHSVTATIDAIRGELRADPLRIHRTGIYYTALEFPVLNFAR